jgi:hypothetical protein
VTNASLPPPAASEEGLCAALCLERIPVRQIDCLAKKQATIDCQLATCAAQASIGTVLVNRRDLSREARAGRGDRRLFAREDAQRASEGLAEAEEGCIGGAGGGEGREAHHNLGANSAHALEEREALLVERTLLVPLRGCEDDPASGGALVHHSDADLGEVVDIEVADAVHALELAVVVLSQADRGLSDLRQKIRGEGTGRERGRAEERADHDDGDKHVRVGGVWVLLEGVWTGGVDHHCGPGSDFWGKG